ncbi:MAG: methionine--tRNA ligase [Victivallales bacterium]|nr:methionine--tRNA ligase [Victivallales bacterium]
MEKFYVTTPIYYVNDKPHIGHAYTTVLADVLSRYHRLMGVETFFLTGTDEHGQKVQKAAERNGMSPKEQCDTTVVRFRELWEKLEITNDDFIRTTEGRHYKIVQEILQDLYDRGLIYKADYSGRYCVTCERFFTSRELGDCMSACPECSRETDEIIETNYFFKMSSYQEWLIDYIKTHPEFILPAFRANETLGFLRKPLDDLCISRPKSRLSWGIELPFDSDFVCYVWFDALVNYISAVGYRRDDANFAKWWPVSCHLIGKDILTTHTVYWPTMLKAMGLEMPESIFAHGWWLTGQSKMSKSAGNVVNPMEMAEKYGVDPFRFFLIAEMSLGQDASFSEEAFVVRYNSNLANDLGNLASRVLKMIIRECGGKVPVPGEPGEHENELSDTAALAVSEMEDAIRGMKLDRGIESVLNAVRAGNRYIELSAPWKLVKEGDTERLGTVLYTAAELLRIVSGLLFPVMPNKMCELRKSLGLKDVLPDIGRLKSWGVLMPGAECSDTAGLFPRIQTDKKKEGKKMTEDKQDTGLAPAEGCITIDEFFNAKLKTAKVLGAEGVDGTTKLLKLQISVGAENRQIVAGIAEHYSPEDVVGKNIVVVSNLKPARIRGIESNGMLLAAKQEGKLTLVTLDADAPSGLDVG